MRTVRVKCLFGQNTAGEIVKNGLNASDVQIDSLADRFISAQSDNKGMVIAKTFMMKPNMDKFKEYIERKNKRERERYSADVEKNREKSRINARKQFAKLKANPVRYALYLEKQKIRAFAHNKLKSEIWAKFERKCFKCGDIIALEMHHNNFDDKEDITLLCKSCHSKLHGEMRKCNKSSKCLACGKELIGEDIDGAFNQGFCSSDCLEYYDRGCKE